MRHGLERLAILFCTPVDRQGFVAATNPDSLTDYMKATVLRGRDLNRVWGDYAPVAEAAQSLIRTARECGGTVFERATLNDFSTATSRFRFVVLFAHWR